MSDTVESRPPTAHHPQGRLPQALQAGHQPIAESDLTPRSSSDSQGSRTFPPPMAGALNTQNSQSNNPYLRMQHAQPNPPFLPQAHNETSAAAWAAVPTLPLERADTSIRPLYEEETLPNHPPSAEAWMDFKVPTEQQGFTPMTTDQNTARAWDEESRTQHNQPMPSATAHAASYTRELQELEAQPFSNPLEHSRPSDTRDKSLPAWPTELDHQEENEKAPEVPPRHPIEDQRQPPEQYMGSESPKLPDVPPQASSSAPAPNQQRNETYQIRLVNWFDASSPVNPRRSPIMVQNANGPCPLLALVNALVLSTPFDVITALVETLRVREQVSLGLLLDAVIDELMSGRRGNVAQALPDVSELYAFLVNLHTGMNVNPRFVESVLAPTNLMDDPIDRIASQIPETRKLGGFEDTPQMRLYGTFAVPLVHGWLPRKNHPVCVALSRSAKTYEDAQSLLFAEEELENKLQAQGLSESEQRLLEDVTSVKYFLKSSPTQLTDYGLDTITETLQPGALAILFRNDHFSTLYKEPRSGRIFTMVTDLGYSGHDEIVWESLVDINGEGSEFFSGDFRPVGNNTRSSSRRSDGPTTADNAGWTTVSRSGGHRQARSSMPANSAMPQAESGDVANAFSQLSFEDTQNKTQARNTEQEDHDLALAMSLQQEEEAREREELSARQRREDELSQAYLDANSRSSQRGGRPQVPPRRGGARHAPVRRKAETDGNDAPPPTYEQAAKGPAYHPPISSPQHTAATSRTNANMGGMPSNRPVRQSSAYSQTSAAFADPRRLEPVVRRQQAGKDKDCILM
ncbi:MAG: hypothetical protein LQ352_007811 [Teloschistes flavicans]|nr:MAG: hypothetical protein LQ352_007811 [Teloschistes flavicans]